MLDVMRMRELQVPSAISAARSAPLAVIERWGAAAIRLIMILFSQLHGRYLVLREVSAAQVHMLLLYFKCVLSQCYCTSSVLCSVLCTECRVNASANDLLCAEVLSALQTVHSAFE